MIYDVLNRTGAYPPDERFQKAFAFLKGTDFSGLEDGKYPIDGENVYAMLSSYDTLLENEKLEVHREYVDIQYMVQGCEMIGVHLLEQPELLEDCPEKDYTLYKGLMERLTLDEKHFMLFWPGEYHAPCNAAGAPNHVRKCVVKVRIPDSTAEN